MYLILFYLYLYYIILINNKKKIHKKLMSKIKPKNRMHFNDIIEISTTIIINRYHLPTAEEIVQHPISE